MMSKTNRMPSTATLGNAFALLLLALIGWYFLRLHPGDWWVAPPRAERWWMAGGVVASYLAGCLGIAWLTRHRMRSHRSLTGPGSIQHDASTICVAYASQTGLAQELAQRTAEALMAGGKLAVAAGVDQLDTSRLSRGGKILFVASTTGEGDPPDHAVRFVREVMGGSHSLERLQYAILALGDRSYQDFCAFGHRLDQWLRRQHATPLFEMIEVDNADERALRHWQSQVEALGGAVASIPPTSPDETWQLSARQELNPGSLGGSVYHLSLLPPPGAKVTWSAGDIAEVRPRHAKAVVAECLQQLRRNGDVLVEAAGETVTLSHLMTRSQLPSLASLIGLDEQAIADSLQPLAHRNYSIASLPGDGTVQLVVRRVTHPDGTCGLCSSWLCDHAPVKGDVEMRLRSNHGFHPPSPSRPLILIGNGTGIAGLRCHLKARVEAGAGHNWLLFGERNERRDFFFREEIESWRDAGAIKRLDLAFSRDQSHRVYVQHLLSEATRELQRWVDDGAAIYVCGSAVGMAPAIDAVLRQHLGDSEVDELMSDGRYRRDVY